MKKILACISSVVFCLFLCTGTVLAQSGSEIKFNVLDGPLTTDKNLVSVSTFINAKQSAGDGIHFTVIVKNNSSKAIFIKNTASKLLIALYNELGYNISITNIDQRVPVNRADAWKFRSESVFPSSLHTNGKEENGDIKMKEYFEVPGGGTSKVDLIIKDVKQVENDKDLENKFLKPKVKLIPGKYKLQMLFSVFSKDRSKSAGFIAGFESPFIDIEYN